MSGGTSGLGWWMKHREWKERGWEGRSPGQNKGNRALIHFQPVFAGAKCGCWVSVFLSDFIKRTVANEWEKPCGELQLCPSFCTDHLTADSRRRLRERCLCCDISGKYGCAFQDVTTKLVLILPQYNTVKLEHCFFFLKKAPMLLQFPLCHSVYSKGKKEIFSQRLDGPD